MQEAIFAAGCFWGVQYYFDQVPGVIETTVGYIGGHTIEPTYEQVCTHTTGHAEAVKIIYDPIKMLEGSKASTMQGDKGVTFNKPGEARLPKSLLTTSGEQQRDASGGKVFSSAGQQDAAFRILLKHFFRMHDPTQLNRQGPDVGDNYRSAIFYKDNAQKKAATKLIAELEKEKRFTNAIVTTLEPATTFWEAEDFHQKFTEKTGKGMCHVPYKPV